LAGRHLGDWINERLLTAIFLGFSGVFEVAMVISFFFPGFMEVKRCPCGSGKRRQTITDANPATGIGTILYVCDACAMDRLTEAQ
jgi:hypothetical protein